MAKFKLADTEFPSKKAAQEWIDRSVEAAYAARPKGSARAMVPLDSEAHRALKGLLDIHHHRAVKVGSGLKGFEIARNTFGTGLICLLHRTDGSRVDMTRKLENLRNNPAHDLRRAMRRAVLSDIERAKAEQWREGGPCGICGKPVWADAHVDHAEIRFADIADEYLSHTPEHPPLADDGPGGMRFEDPTHPWVVRWRRLHKEAAKVGRLVVTHAACNTEKERNKETT